MNELNVRSCVVQFIAIVVVHIAKVSFMNEMLTAIESK